MLKVQVTFNTDRWTGPCTHTLEVPDNADQDVIKKELQAHVDELCAGGPFDGMKVTRIHLIVDGNLKNDMSWEAPENQAQTGCN